MRIKIDAKNEKKIKTVLAAEQKGCVARLVSYDDLVGFVKKSESHLENHFVSKKSRAGSRYEYCEGVGCNSYKYRAMATRVILERGSADWYLVLCFRSTTSTTRGCRNDWFIPSQRAIESAHKRIETELEKI